MKDKYDIKDDIKKIGIVQYLKRLGEVLYELSKEEELPEEEKELLYQKYYSVIENNKNEISQNIKDFKVELPEKVLKITKDFDGKFLKVMEECLSVVYNYTSFISSEEKEVQIINDCIAKLDEVQNLIYDADYALKQVYDNDIGGGDYLGEG
jgi:arginine repressor